MAAAAKNQNALSHGINAGVLPKGCDQIRKTLVKFRTSLEAAVVALKSEVSLTDAAAINSAERWERHAQLAARWLKLESKSLTPEQRLAFSRDVARASSERDKCLRTLGLDAKPDPWAAIDALALPPLPPPEPEVTPTPADAQAGHTGDDTADGSAAPAPTIPEPMEATHV